MWFSWRNRKSSWFDRSWDGSDYCQIQSFFGKCNCLTSKLHTTEVIFCHIFLRVDEITKNNPLILPCSRGRSNMNNKKHHISPQQCEREIWWQWNLKVQTLTENPYIKHSSFLKEMRSRPTTFIIEEMNPKAASTISVFYHIYLYYKL